MSRELHGLCDVPDNLERTAVGDVNNVSARATVRLNCLQVGHVLKAKPLQLRGNQLAHHVRVPVNSTAFGVSCPSVAVFFMPRFSAVDRAFGSLTPTSTGRPHEKLGRLRTGFPNAGCAPVQPRSIGRIQRELR